MSKLWGILIIILSGCQSAYLLKSDQLSYVGHKSYSLMERSGKSYLLSDIYQNHKGTVLLFWQNTCPCVKRYQKRIDDLFNKYGKNNISFAYVSSNSEPFNDVKTEYTNRGINLRLFRDDGAQLAKALQVKGTPTAVLLDSNGSVRFMGWIDNEQNIGETGRRAYLENALDDFIADRDIRVPTSPMFGCPIR